MDKKVNVTAAIIIVVGMIIFIIISINQRVKEDKKLIESGILTSGIVNKVGIGGTPSARSYYLEYSFYTEEDIYIENTKSNFSKLDEDSKNLLLNKKIPVVYLAKEPYINRMLINKADFQEFNLKFPDSLNCYNHLETY